MSLKPSLILLLLFFYAIPAFSQQDSIVIENSTVARKFYFRRDSAGLYTAAFINKVSGQNYANPGTEEFNITVNNTLLSGRNCTYISHTFQKTGDTSDLTVLLQTPLQNVFVQLSYKLYATVPLIKKQLSIINRSTAKLQLVNLDVEHMNFQVVDKYMNEVYANYGSFLTRLPYKGDYNDAAIMVFNMNVKQGAIFGNEAPSVLKNTEIYSSKHGLIQIGMRHINETFPFENYLQPGETFSSPCTFIYVFNATNWQEGFEGAFADYTRKYAGVHLFSMKDKPFMMYNTWQPFQADMDEKLLMDCADKVAAAGADLFTIDAGWYKYLGDYDADSSKFPHGLKYVSDYIRSKGMKVGLWFSAAGVNGKSEVALQHPEWLMKTKDYKNANLHDTRKETDSSGMDGALRTMSLASPYYDHIKNVISKYVNELNLSYIKLDFSIANSAYLHDAERSGDYESNPEKMYQDRAASYYSNYMRMLQLMDELHAAFPALLIDCTFEVWGRYNVSDYALMQHGDYDWIVNFDFPPPTGPISVRQMNYDRSRVIPPVTMNIGNMQMNFPNEQYVYFSLAPSNFCMMGDARKLTGKQEAFYKKWNTYFKSCDAKYQYTQFRQTYDVFDRATDKNWDGCYRINTEKQGGLMFFYRNNSNDAQRNFTIPFLQPQSRYRIFSFGKNKTIAVLTGAELKEKGLTVKIPDRYSALVLEIEKE